MKPKITHLLLIDDDPSYVRVLEHQLHANIPDQFEFSWVSDTGKALERLGNDPRIDLIIMDYYLSDSNGIEAAKRIMDAGFSVPIIFLTTNKDVRLAIEAMKFGIEDYLVKEEINETILTKTILNTLERFRLNKEKTEMEKERLFSERTSEAIQELIVTMCHEFNNPLAAIKISADILARQPITEEERSLLKRLNRNISELEEQIIKLRDLNTPKNSVQSLGISKETGGKSG